jgi:curved DNA-binding protein CbpA
VRVPAAPPTTKPAAPPPEATADDVPPEFRARFEEARQRLESMEDENYFQMLGVATSVGADEVRQAFLSLAARWHPDRAPPNITALRDLHERIFAYLSEAQDTLSRDEVRGRYFAAVQEGGGTPNSQRRIGALIEAATDAQKAEVCMKRREYAEAERLSRRALKVAPDDPNALTVLASALAEIRADGPHDEAIKLLQHAVEISPKHDRAHVLLAMLYRRIGNSVRALDHFRLAAAANPRNVDATREVRLAEMRGRTSGAPQPDPGAGAKPRESLFSKLLKR